MSDAFILRNRVALAAAGADAAAAAAKRKAVEIGVPMCIAVVDAGGHLLAFARNDDTRLANIQMAITKAVSAVMRRRATADELKLRPEDPIQTIRTTLAAGAHAATALSGGIPIYVDGELVGGIGVSGGHREQDIACAEAGIAALGVR